MNDEVVVPFRRREPEPPGPPNPLSRLPYTLAGIRAELAGRSLIDFTRLAWSAIEASPYVDNWHLHVMAERLEAVNRGEIRRLLIMCPPRHTKSRMVAIFWPAWTWLRERAGYALSGAWVKFVFCSYSYALSSDHAMRLKWLINSPVYRGLRDKPLKILKDVDRTDQFEFEEHGGAQALSMLGGVTGFGGHVRVMDDPHNIKEIDSAVKRAEAKKFYDDVWPSRVIDPKNAPEVVIMQRAHQDDLAGHIMGSARAAQFEVLCLPMEYDPEHPNVSPYDRRTEPGELLDLNRFGHEGYAQLVAGMSSFAKSAQMNQRPVPRGGTLFQNAQWRFEDQHPRIMRLVRYWDKAATEEGAADDPDYTAGALGGVDQVGRFWLIDMQRGRWSPHQLEERIAFVARELDPPGTQIWLEEEPGSAGKEITSRYQRGLLRGFPVRGHRPTGSKASRADGFIAAAEAGNIVLLRKPWNRAFLEECENFTGEEGGSHDDQVDAAVGCFGRVMAGVAPLVW